MLKIRSHACARRHHYLCYDCDCWCHTDPDDLDAPWPPTTDRPLRVED